MNLFLITAAVIILSMIFSLAESSIVGANEFKIKNLIKQNHAGSEKLLKIVKNRSKYLSSIIFCNTLINLFGSMIIGAQAAKAFNELNYAAFISSVTVIMLLFSEIKPKTFAATYPEKVGCFLSKPLSAITWILTPILSIISALVGNKIESNNLTICELNHMLRSASDSGVINTNESKFIQNLFTIRNKKAGDIIVRGGDIITIPIHETLGYAQDKALKSNHKRFIAVNKDNKPVGVSFKSDILAKLLNNGAETVIAEIVYPVLVVAEDKPLLQLLDRLYKTDTHLAVIVDHEDKMIGVVTLSNIQQGILSV